jgi:carboxylesterase
MRKLILLAIAALTLTDCSKEPAIDDTMLDSGLYFDLSLYEPAKYLVSASNPNPTAEEAVKPVIIAIHGYGATTFEWDEFRSWAGNRTDFSISQVLLGGHGRDYKSFKESSWKDWQKPIMDEYEKLEQQGYKNISFAGSSTGSTLILDLLANGYFDTRLKPKHVFLVDPIIVPSNKLLSLAGLIGPMIGYTTVENTAGEEKYYYHYRPQETLNELRKVINKLRTDLENGITLPAATTLKVFKSEKDDVADPVSAVLIYKGIRSSTGERIAVRMVSSDLHVFTRLNLRANTATTQDVQNQIITFQEIADTILLP